MYYVGVTCHIIQPGPFKTSIVDPGEMQFALQKSYDATDSEVRAFYGQQWLDKCEDSLSIYRFCLVCLLVFFRPTRESFTHMETSQLPMKGCNLLPTLDTYGH